MITFLQYFYPNSNVEIIFRKNLLLATIAFVSLQGVVRIGNNKFTNIL